MINWRKTKRELGYWYRALLEALPGEIGCAVRRRAYGFRAAKTARVLSHVVIYSPENLSLGARVGISVGCQINANGRVTIGNDVLIGPGTLVWSQNHKFRDPHRSIVDQGFERAEVVIEDDVWIAAGCIILPGVRLARGTVVAAGAVVTVSTEPYSVVAGVPARLVDRRTGPAAEAAEAASS